MPTSRLQNQQAIFSKIVLVKSRIIGPEPSFDIKNRNKTWPKLDLPKTRGEITVADLLSAPEGAERDEMIQRWCVSVWQAYRKSHQQVRDLISKYLLDS